MPEIEVINPIDDDGVIEDSSVIEDDPTYICPICGQTSESVGGMNRHIGKSHPDHPEAKIPNQRGTSTRRKSETIKPDVMFDRTKPKAVRAKALSKAIVDDFNPFMLTMVQQTGVPDYMMNWQPVLGGPSVGSMMGLTKFQADLIARGYVEMDGVPALEAMGRMVGPIVPYFFGLAAIAAIVMQGFKIVTLRRMVMEQMSTMAESMSNGNSTDGAKRQVRTLI